MGWSGETESNNWRKFDVELEQEDLTRILRENDLPDGIDERLPTKLCFQLLQNEAECLLLEKMKSVGYPTVRADERISFLVGKSGEIIDAIKSRLNVV